MFCSTIIPTIARPSLDRAVESVLAQELEGDAFEVIVVNDSGAPLIPAPWHSHDQVRIIDTRQREKCFARNTGAAVARGRYLNFLDDDDWLLPGAFAAFRDYIRKNGEAKVLYGNVLYVDVCEEVIGELNLGRSGNCHMQMVAGSLILLLGALIAADAFFAVGGFDPQYRITEDKDLFRRLSLLFDFTSIPHAVACALKGEGWETSASYEDAVPNQRESRERALRTPGAYRRMQASADTSYWRGRLVHTYLASTRWHLQQWRLATAALRLLTAAWSGLTFINHLLDVDFWLALKDDQVPATQKRVLEK